MEELIAGIRKYVHLSLSDIEIINELFEKEEYKSNSFILKSGFVCNKLWFIAKGLVRFSIFIDGEERTFVFRGEGDFTSDIEGFLQRQPSSKNIITIEKSTLYSISYEKLQTLFKQITYGERFGRLLVEGVFISAVKHIISFYTESPEIRYKKLIESNNDYIQRIPQYHIASFLGIQPQSLCRIKKRLFAKI